MYGWRGRIGIILPADNTVLEPDFYRFMPEGVSAHILRLPKTPRPDMPQKGVEMVSTFLYTRVAVIGYMCAASSFMLGVAGNRKFIEQVEQETEGLPTFTASTAMEDALNAVQARNVAVLAPHPGEIADYLKRYLQDAGFNPVSHQAMNLSVQDINDSTPEMIYKRAREADHPEADALFIAATNFRAIDTIKHLERDLGKPVISSNQAALWKALSLLNIHPSLPQLGQLLTAAC